MQKTRSNAASIQEDAPPKDLKVCTEVPDLPKPKGTRPTRVKQGQAPSTQATVESDTEAQPAKKKKKGLKTNLALSSPQVQAAKQATQPKTKKGKATPEPRSDLPGCKGRNNHPGVIAQPRPKHTPAQVADAKAADEERKKQLAELDEQKKRLYAQMEIDEDMRELESEVNAIRWLSDIVRAQATESNAVSSESEKFDMDVGSSEDTDSEDTNKECQENSKKAEVSTTLPSRNSSLVTDLP
jgi:hypothetical protein